LGVKADFIEHSAEIDDAAGLVVRAAQAVDDDGVWV
jgi:hypothetical protein